MHSVLQARSSEGTVAWLAETALFRRWSLINVIVTRTRASRATHDVLTGALGDCISHVASMS